MFKYIKNIRHNTTSGGYKDNKLIKSFNTPDKGS